MHWTTRYGNGRDRPQSNYLGDDGEECGCFSDDSWDGWTTNIKRRKHTVCNTHKRREERKRKRDMKRWEKARKRSIRHSAVENEYNRETKHRLEELEDFGHGIFRKGWDELEETIEKLVDDIVPIKYMRDQLERGYCVKSMLTDEKKMFVIQKIRGRYYCCKNKVAYYKEQNNKIDRLLKREEKRFIQTRGWTEDDMTLRDYKWIKNNDKVWLKEYKRRIRMEQTLKDEANWEVKMLFKMYF